MDATEIEAIQINVRRLKEVVKTSNFKGKDTVDAVIKTLEYIVRKYKKNLKKESIRQSKLTPYV